LLSQLHEFGMSGVGPTVAPLVPYVGIFLPYPYG